MASKYWIKLYHEILDDPKMGMLSPELWRFTVELFLLAGEVDCNGTLPSVTKIAWRLRYTILQVESWLQQISTEAGIFTLTESGWIVANFEKRQAASDINERVKQHRERKRKQKSNDTSNVLLDDNVTEMKQNVTPDTDTDTDIVIIEEIEASPPKKRHKDFDKVCQEYQREIGGLSQTISDMIGDDLSLYPADWIIQAMKRAAVANIRRYDYTQGILKNWQVVGGPQNDKPKNGHKNGVNGTNGTHHKNNGSGHTQATNADPNRIPSVNIYDDD